MAMSTLSFLWELIYPHRRQVYFAGAALAVLSILMLLPPLIFGMVVDDVLSRGEYHKLPILVIGLLCVPLLALGVRTTGDYVVGVLGQRLIFDLRLRLYRKIHRLSCNYLNNHTTGMLMERLRGDVTQIQSVVTNQTLSLITQAFYGLLAIFFMFWICWPIALIVISAMGLYALNYHFFVRRIRKVQRRFRRKMDLLSGLAQERLAGQMLVKSYGNERLESQQFLRENFKTERVHHRFRLYNGLYGACSSFFSSATQAVVLLAGAYLVIQGDLTFGLLLALHAYAANLLQPVVQLAELSNQLQQAGVALSRIFEQMQAETDSIEQPGIRLEQLKGEVAFENLGFEYEPGKPVLQNLNLHIQPGMSVALVGETGCGKSTITNLLYKFYHGQKGILRVDGHDIRELDANWYRRQLAIVPQDAVVFDTSIRANIMYGKPNATDEQILEAARIAEFRSIIDRQAYGLDTILGEEGVKLSVGEKQRLSIARAVLADPSILILDEATSSLDPHSEAAIQVALKRVLRDRTSFVIAHRLSTIVDVDLIVVLDQGRVLEMGNHQQLMNKQDGRYRKLFLTQMGASQPREAVG